MPCWGVQKLPLFLVIGLGCHVGKAYHPHRLVTPDHRRSDPAFHPDPSFPPELSDLLVNGQPDELGSRQSRFQHGADVGTCACSGLRSTRSGYSVGTGSSLLPASFKQALSPCGFETLWRTGQIPLLLSLS